MIHTNEKKSVTFLCLLANRARQSDISRWSVSIAYYITLSLFPLLVVIGTILPYFNISPDAILPYLDSVIPEPIVQIIAPTLRNLLTVPKGGLLSLGVLVVIWSASRSMKYIQSGIDCAYGLSGSRLYITSRIASIVTFIVIILLLVALMLATTFGRPLLESLLAYFGWDSGILRHFNTIKWLASAGGMMLTFTIIYRITPNIKHRFRDVFAGALLATVCLIALVQLYAFYLGLSGALTAYGVISGIFVLMVWLRMLGYIILLGGVLNAALFEMKNGTPQPKEGRFDAWVQRLLDSAWERVKRILRLNKDDHNDKKGDSGMENKEAKPCSNTHPCSCPDKGCANHGKCCDCVAYHKRDGSLPMCMR